jgi:hypothetical protein
LLLAFKGLSDDLELIRNYQRDKWGTATGETCVIELCGLAAPSMLTSQDRTTYLSKRIKRIRREVLKHVPKFIVMYGVGQREEWEQIAGATFDSNGICRIGKTVAAITPHPVTRGLGNEYWVSLGRSMRQRDQIGR